MIISRNRRNGAALIVVMWALAIIGAVVAAYFARGVLEGQYAREQKAEAEARALARAGLACFIQRFLADEDKVDLPGEKWLFPEDDPLPAFPDGEVEIRVSDYGSRINLNLAVDGAQLLLLFRSKPQPVNAILDWRDENKDPRVEGAEAGDYRGSVVPADGMFLCPEEVMLVMGLDKFKKTVATETTVVGPANPNLIQPQVWKEILKEAGLDELEIDMISKQFEQARAEAKSSNSVLFQNLDDLRRLPSVTMGTVEILAPYLTFTGQVNPNFASERQLQVAISMIGENIDLAKVICDARVDNPYKNIDDLMGVFSNNKPNGYKIEIPMQVFSLLTTLVGVDVVGKTKAGVPYRIAAVIQRFHPKLDSTHWQCRILYWREWPGCDFPPPAEDVKDDDGQNDQNDQDQTDGEEEDDGSGPVRGPLHP